MAPTPEEFSDPGSVNYDSNTMSVGDGTWDFTKNTFLLPNLQSPNFETMRFNGMGNRFSTLTEYHPIIVAHAVLAAIAFLLLIPFAIMIARFYSKRPGFAVKYHAQLQITACLLILASFILGMFAVGQRRSLTNPHHGIGVAIFVLLVVQLLGGRLVRSIIKARSFRIMLHQWSGRAIALLGMVQIPLGLTLYGSPLWLFICYAVWMLFLVILYFILSFQSAGRRELYMSGARSELGGRSEVTGMTGMTGMTRITETEYLGGSEYRPNEKDKGWKRWIGPLAAGAGLFAFMNRRKDKPDEGYERSRSPSLNRRSRPTVLSSRHSRSYMDSEKYTDYSPSRRGPKQGGEGGGGGFMKLLGGAAAAVGAGKLFSNFRDRRGRDGREEAYSAVSTETPRRYRAGRASSLSDITSSDFTELPRRGAAATEASTLPPSAHPAVMAGAMSAADSRLGSQRPITPRPSHGRNLGRRSLDDSDYSSYVSPSRRPAEASRKNGGAGQGVLAGLGMGWLAKKFADRRAKKEDRRIRDEELLRSETDLSRYTGEPYQSPPHRDSRRPPARRPSTGQGRAPAHSELSSVESRPPGGTYTAPPAAGPKPVAAPVTPTRGTSRHSHSVSRSRRESDATIMPAMPDDPLYSEGEYTADSRPRRRTSSRRRKAGDAAMGAAAARAGALAAEQGHTTADERDRYGSPHSVSVKLKVHDDKDRNVTLRRLTEEEAREARSRGDSESSLSGLESPTQGRTRYRRDSTRLRVAEAAAEQKVETDPLAPPNPAFAKAKRQKDSAYYSGQPGPSGPAGSSPAAGQTMSTLASYASPESHGTWSGMSPSPSTTPADKVAGSAADNRRRRRLERQRAGSARPSAGDMFE